MFADLQTRRGDVHPSKNYSAIVFSTCRAPGYSQSYYLDWSSQMVGLKNTNIVRLGAIFLRREPSKGSRFLVWKEVGYWLIMQMSIVARTQQNSSRYGLPPRGKAVSVGLLPTTNLRCSSSIRTLSAEGTKTTNKELAVLYKILIFRHICLDWKPTSTY